MLAAVGATEVGRAASFRPLVWVGKLSYSLYLWHFLWVQLFFGRPLVILVLSFASAALSYYLIEQPFRRPRRGRTRSWLRRPISAPDLVAVSDRS